MRADECWVLPSQAALDQLSAAQDKKILMFCMHTWDRKVGCRVGKGTSRPHSKAANPALPAD